LHQHERRKNDRPSDDTASAPIEDKGERNTEEEQQDGGDAKGNQPQVNLFCLHVIGEHPRSAARGKGFAKMTGLFASPLHRFVRPVLASR